MTQSVYDKAGQQLQAIDAKNKPTSYVFNARGQRVTEIDRLGFATHWAYDAGGNLLSLTDAEAQTTSYTYNDAGQRITEQYPDHIAGAVIGDAGYGIITFSYDALDRRTVKEDQQGDTTSYNFDMSGRMLTRVYVGHPTSPLAGQTDADTFTYDRNGRMLSGIKGRYGNTVTFSYDDRGQQIQETLTTHGQTYTVGYQKNELGQTTQLQYPDASLVDRDYTPRGQLLSVDYAPAGAAASSDVADFVYDAGGRETTRNLGNGLTTSRTYFADNQIQSIATPTVETLTYTYDPNKNPTSETRSGVMAPYSWSTGPTGFDDEDRLTNWQRTNGDTQSWNLSPVHDWTSTTINGATQTRTHGPAHEILTMAGAEVSTTPATLQHDPKGNMTTDDRGCGMTWDFENMLQSFAANGVTGLKDATYEYDAIGRRVAKTVAEPGGDQTTLFVQVGQQVACEYTSGIAITDCDRKYAYGTYLDEVLAYIDASVVTGTTYWLHQNRQYNGYALSVNAGFVLQYYRYDASGKIDCFSSIGASQGTVPEVGLTPTFIGRTVDNESALFNFRRRMYAAQIGRFNSRDPEGYVDGLNSSSSYFSISHLDPSGTKCVVAIHCWPRAGEQHCGLTIVSDVFPFKGPSGVWVDAYPNPPWRPWNDPDIDFRVGENTPIEVPGFTEGPRADLPDSACECLASRMKEWNSKYRGPYWPTERNSNHALRCLTEKCLSVGNWPSGGPIGWDCKECAEWGYDSDTFGDFAGGCTQTCLKYKRCDCGW